MADADEQSEVWRPIRGTGKAYEASDRGRVRVVTPPTGGRPVGPDGVLATHPDRRGRPLVMIRLADGRQVAKSVAACVLLAFVGRRPSPKHRAAFASADRSDLSPGNLRWQTPLENHDAARANERAPGRPEAVIGGRRCFRCRRCREWKPVGKFHRLPQT